MENGLRCEGGGLFMKTEQAIINESLFTSRTDEWGTPKNFFDRLHKEFNFTLDPCASGHNAKCEVYYTIEDDGLTKDWRGESVFCNPPYGRKIAKWVEKCWEESRKSNTLVVMLIPARTDTRYWHEWIFPYAKEIRFVKGRLKFEGGAGNENSAPFPSAVVVFDPEWSFIYGGRTTVMERD